MSIKKITSSRLTVRSATTLLDWQKKVSDVRVVVAPRQTLSYFFMNGGAKRRTVTIRLSRGASVTFYGICIGAKNDEDAEHGRGAKDGTSDNPEHTTDIHVEHAGPHSTSFVSLKGVFTGQSRGIINGTIHIHKAAQGANARLEERVLLLSSTSSAKTIPNLEIEANDVKASHAATVSRLSEDEIFYLQTRGLTREHALRELIRAFLASQLTHLPDEKMRATITTALLSALYEPLSQRLPDSQPARKRQAARVS